MKAPLYTQTGTKKSDLTLDAKVFGLTPNQDLIAQSYRAGLANIRTNNAKTLTRGLVSGGGRKPYRQKGTGRARTGSIRNPLWRTGGIIFGPTGERNYRINIPKNMRRAALAQTLSSKADCVKVVEKIDFEKPQTRQAVALLASVQATGNVVVVMMQKTAAVVKSFSNIGGVLVMSPAELDVVSILDADTLVFEQAALESLKPKVEKT